MNKSLLSIRVGGTSEFVFDNVSTEKGMEYISEGITLGEKEVNGSFAIALSTWRLLRD